MDDVYKGRINPNSKTYCGECDRGGHVCPGCGDNVSHDKQVCDTCQGEVARGER